jgi:hypothetical protein
MKAKTIFARTFTVIAFLVIILLNSCEYLGCYKCTKKSLFVEFVEYTCEEDEKLSLESRGYDCE